MPSGLSAQSWTPLATSITCEGEVATLPAARLANPRVSKRFRVAGLSPGDTARQVRVAFHQPVPVDRISLVRPRRNSLKEDAEGAVFGENDLLRHRLSSTDAHDGDVYDSGWIASGMVNGYGYHDHIVPRSAANAVRTASYAALDFDAVSRAAAPDNFVDFGRLDYWNLWRFSIGFRAPFTYGWRDRSTATPTLDGGGEIVNDRTRGWREIGMLFSGVRKTERAALLRFLEKTRSAGRFYLVADANVADPYGCVIARNLTPDLDQTSRAFSRFELSLRESL